MKRLLYFILIAIVGITIATADRAFNNNIHTWILLPDSAVEIYDYNPLKCVPNQNTYCKYETTTDFSVHSMPDSTFLTLVNAGYFTGYNINKRYIP